MDHPLVRSNFKSGPKQKMVKRTPVTKATQRRGLGDKHSWGGTILKFCDPVREETLQHGREDRHSQAVIATSTLPCSASQWLDF